MANVTMPSGLVLHDFASYLQANNHLINTPTTRKHTPGSVPIAEAAQPVSTIYISQLTTRCQAKAISTRYEIHEVQGELYRFEGELHLETGSTNVLTVKLQESIGEAQLNKKNVKALLAQKALAALDADPEIERNIIKSATTGSSDDENWVGRLLEWFNSLPSNIQTYHEPPKYIINEVHGNNTLTFTGQVLLEGLDQPMTFGGEIQHPSKKAAKAASARDAVLWLRSQNKMPSLGPVSKKARARSPLESPAPRRGTITIDNIEIPAEDADGTTKSYVQRVDELVPHLGMPIPQYFLFSDPNIPSLYSGGASLHGLDGLPGQEAPDENFLIGTVHNVVGRKKAREECARLVYEMLDSWRKAKLAAQDGDGDVDMDGVEEKKQNGVQESVQEKILPGLLTIREKPSS